MEFPSNPSPLPATPLGLRPGDFPLGSLESRAAARALLDENLATDQQNRLRVVVTTIGKLVRLETSTCQRYQCADSREPGKSFIIEIIKLDGDHPTEAQSEKIEQWLSKVPIDGQT